MRCHDLRGLRAVQFCAVRAIAAHEHGAPDWMAAVIAKLPLWPATDHLRLGLLRCRWILTLPSGEEASSVRSRTNERGFARWRIGERVLFLQSRELAR